MATPKIDEIQEIKERYINLKGKEGELEEQESNNAKKSIEINKEFNTAYYGLEDAKRNHYRKENELNEKRYTFIGKKNKWRLRGICASFYALPILIAIIFQIPTQNVLYIHLASILSCSIAAFIDIVAFGKKHEAKYINKFNSQEEIIKLKDEIKQLEEIVKVKEKELNEIRNTMHEHTKKVDKLEKELSNIRATIILLKQNTFEKLLGIEEVQEQEQKLSLK